MCIFLARLTWGLDRWAKASVMLLMLILALQMSQYYCEYYYYCQFALGFPNHWIMLSFLGEQNFLMSIDLYRGKDPYTGAYVRLWLLYLLPISALALRTNKALRKRKLKGDGCCTFCGYDLRATPHRCPECGAVPQVGRV